MVSIFERSRPFYCPLGKYCKVWHHSSDCKTARSGCTFGTDKNLDMRNPGCPMPKEIVSANLIQQVKICPECNGILDPDCDYPNDLICGECNKVFDAETLEFVEAF